MEAAEHWAREQGCSEMASDTQLGNVASQEAHQRLGYTIVERLVAFRKPLT
jgi:aminoglycoside 6'-N-acetyltransferase I